MDSFFVVSDQLCVKGAKEFEAVNFESLKGKENDIQLSQWKPKSKNVKTPSPPDSVEDFTVKIVNFKVFFMNEISNHKNEIERLKQVANQENNLNMENHSAVNLVNCQISLFQRENTFIKTELSNKQNIKKLLRFNCNQLSLNSSKININEKDRVNEKNSKGNPLKYKDKKQQ